MPKSSTEHAFEIANAIVNYISIHQDLFRTDRVNAMAEAKQKLIEKLEAALRRQGGL